MDNTVEKSKGKNSAAKITILVAIIGLIGTLGGAVILNWDKIFLSDSKNISISPETEKPAIDPKVEVEKLAGKWISAWMNGDADNFIKLASEPFYFDQKIVLTRSVLREEFIQIFNEKGNDWKRITIESIKVLTAREYQEQGHDLSSDRIFNKLQLTLDDYVVIVIMELESRKEGLIMFARREGSEYLIVGTWD